MELLSWKSKIRTTMLANGSAPDFIEDWLQRSEVQQWYEGSLTPNEVVLSIEERENSDCI